MTTRIFSSGIRRREDPRLISGRATYTDDITLPGAVYAAILRSPHAHARIRRVNTSRAARAEGVVAVYTGADLEGVAWRQNRHPGERAERGGSWFNGPLAIRASARDYHLPDYRYTDVGVRCAGN